MLICDNHKGQSNGEVLMTSSVSKLKTPQNLLNHILEQPQLPAVIQRLDAPVLTKLIRHIGLEDSAEIVSMTTTNQLNLLLDEDLWCSEAPGRNELFDADRFGLWLEILLESGSVFAAKKLQAMDEDLVTLGLCRLLRVVNFNDFSHGINSVARGRQKQILDDVLDGALSQEFGTYLVIAKNYLRWDAIQTLLVELNELDHAKLTRLLERCSRIFLDDMEVGGEFDNILAAENTLEEDMAAERDERRGRKGYVGATDAAYFLASARVTALKKIIAAKSMERDARVYFRRVSKITEPEESSEPTDKDTSNAYLPHVMQFLETLQAAEVLPSAEQAKLSWNADDRPHHLPLVGAMSLASELDPQLYSQRLVELTYLSNILISGCSFKGRAFTPGEAAEAAFSVCNLGSEYLRKANARQRGETELEPLPVILEKYHLVKLFKSGWKILNDNVIFYTAGALLKYFQNLKLQQTDSRQKIQMAHMAYLLQSYISSKTPWKFENKMDLLLTILDGPTTMALTGLLQEYPTISKIVCSRQQTHSSDHIWRLSHIRSIKQFVDKVL
jgi:hypothetical protein